MLEPFSFSARRSFTSRPSRRLGLDIAGGSHKTQQIHRRSTLRPKETGIVRHTVRNAGNEADPTLWFPAVIATSGTRTLAVVEQLGWCAVAEGDSGTAVEHALDAREIA